MGLSDSPMIYILFSKCALSLTCLPQYSLLLINLFVCLFIYSFTCCLSIYLFIYLSVYLFIYLHINQ